MIITEFWRLKLSIHYYSTSRVAEAPTNSQGNMNFNTSISTQATVIQPVQNYKSSQFNELGLFYQPPNDDIIYHVNCKPIVHDIQVYDDVYDYEFFHLARYHVTCKSLIHSSIINILNKEIYGRDYDANDLKRECNITLYQKFNLELNLKDFLSSIHFWLDTNVYSWKCWKEYDMNYFNY